MMMRRGEETGEMDNSSLTDSGSSDVSPSARIDSDEEVTSPPTTATTTTTKPWIRGVNIGGWLLMERYITPYQFALTTCHVQGDFCWYPGQINSPPNAELCDLYRCAPLLSESVFGQQDFPLDEYSLWKAFGNNTEAAEQWLNYHLRYFVTEKDIIAVKESGATHVRVPLAHWILESQEDLKAAGEVWIVGERWKAFQRLVRWCRKHGLQVWPDIHSAPGSQNGFDNSGRQYSKITSRGWIENPDHVLASLQVIQSVTARIVEDGMGDVVTGFGLINEPFLDCNRTLYVDFLERGFNVVKETMGPNTYVMVSDLFQSDAFNDGKWWVDPTKYNNTFIDTHYYQVFAETTRAISPRQHIALACANEYHVNRAGHKSIAGISSCCFQDAPENTIASEGVRHMVGEWSAAVDMLPKDLVYAIMQNIASTGVALNLQRQLSPERKEFLRHFVQAQEVIYEMDDKKGAGGAWFFWTLKMEGGAFAEWDFLRGIKEEWIPKIPDPNVSSTSLFGTCYDIMGRTSDDPTIIDEYPDPQGGGEIWKGPVIDDDVVLSHGNSILYPDKHKNKSVVIADDDFAISPASPAGNWWATGVLLLFLAGFMCAWRQMRGRSSGYSSIPQSSMPN